MGTSRPLAWLLLLAAGGAPAFAQTRPLLTEEATTGPHGRVLLELGAEAIRNEPNFLTGRERTRWQAPELRLVWSAADNVELDLEWVGRVGVRADPDFGSVSDFGDVSLRTKLRLLAAGAGGTTVAARIGVTLPQTSFGNGLGPNTLRMSAQMLLSQAWERAALHANAGLAIQDEPLRPHEQRDFLAYGVALEYALSPVVRVLGELAGLAGDGMPGADAHAELRLGMRWVAGRMRWDMALRRGLAQADGDWGLAAGLTWTLRQRGGAVRKEPAIPSPYVGRARVGGR